MQALVLKSDNPNTSYRLSKLATISLDRCCTYIYFHEVVESFLLEPSIDKLPIRPLNRLVVTEQSLQRCCGVGGATGTRYLARKKEKE